MSYTVKVTGIYSKSYRHWI